METAMIWAIIGVFTDGTKKFYTGRSGVENFVGTFDEAFTYTTLEGARRQATQLNKMTAIHGWRFYVPSIQSYSGQKPIVATEAYVDTIFQQVGPQ